MKEVVVTKLLWILYNVMSVPRLASSFTYRSNRLFVTRSTSLIPIKQQSSSTTEKSEEEKEAIKAARKARKAEKQRLALEKKIRKQKEQEALTLEPVTYLHKEKQDEYEQMGDYSLIQSRSETGRDFENISFLADKISQTVWIRGRLHSIRIKGGSCFLVIRQNAFHTVQGTFFKDKTQPQKSQKMLRYLKTLTVESVVDVEGTVVEANVKSCSVNNVEIQLHRVHTVSKANAVLPFGIEDASRSSQEVEESQETERPFPRLGQELRLDHRWLDLRVPANNAIIRIVSAVCQLFRESLYEQGFIEIHTPKLIQGESESGAGVFKVDYFGSVACLAQSPQLYKQMAISSDLPRVFEIAPVFRAEKSHTRRHLTEFMGLDLEMAITDHYIETLRVIHEVFKHIFNGLESRYASELATIRKQYHSTPVKFTSEPCIVHWPEAMQLLKEEGCEIEDELGDLTGAQELALGAAIQKIYNTDFFMLDKYPAKIRPFYTMPDADDTRYSNSYDIFLRGQEICSGAQRCHDPDLLAQILEQKNVAIGEGLEKYLESFNHAAPPHAGAGIGLERVVFLYLGLDNVRKASMFPRDPNRCSP